MGQEVRYMFQKQTRKIPLLWFCSAEYTFNHIMSLSGSLLALYRCLNTVSCLATLLTTAAYLSQVEFEYVADVMGVKLGKLHQVLAILKRLAQLLYPRLGAIHAVDPLHSTKTKCIQHRKI